MFAMAAAFLVGGPVAVASGLPAPSGSGEIPNITVWDEADHKISLMDLLQTASSPLIVLPVYTRCNMSCPVLARKLKEECTKLGKAANYRVLLFSFDPSEDAESLRAFRGQEQLPSDWKLVRADGANIRRLCDFFHYSVMAEGMVLVHPNQTFLLDHTFTWRATLTGTDWDTADLQKWLRQTESSGFSAWVTMHPERLVWIGFGGLLLSLAVTLSWLILRKPNVAEAVR
jgi:cytochrome oxidase Cu insertion factor (SCO1/SenC/PrrC family)